MTLHFLFKISLFYQVFPIFRLYEKYPLWPIYLWAFLLLLLLLIYMSAFESTKQIFHNHIGQSSQNTWAARILTQICPVKQYFIIYIYIYFSYYSYIVNICMF